MHSSRALIASLTLASLAPLLAGDASAQAPQGGACPSPPPTPKGHILAKIEKVEGNGAVTLRHAEGLTGRRKPKAGDDVFLLTCKGDRAPGRGSHTQVQSASGAVVSAVFGLPKSQLEGRYGVIDTGYDSDPPLFEGEVRPPPGYIQVRVINVAVSGGKTRVTFGTSYAGGVFPGAPGYLVNEKGQPARNGNFTLDTVTSERSVVGTLDTSLDEVNRNPQAFVLRSSRRCDAPDPTAPSAADMASALQGGPAPAGWMFVDVPTSRTGWPSITLPVGADQGVVAPARALFVVGKPAPGAPSTLVPAPDLTEVRKGSSTVVAPSSLRSTQMRVLVTLGRCK